MWVRLTLVTLAPILLACTTLTLFILFRTQYALARVSILEFVQLRSILQSGDPLGWQILIQEAYSELLLALGVCVALALGFALILARYLSRTFSRFASSLHRLGRADLSARAEIPNAPREIVALTQDFNRMVERLEHLERERRFESAAIAHELRTPITAMRLRVMGLLDGVHDLELAQVRPLNAQLNTLERLAEDLQTLTLHDAGHLSLNPFTLSIPEVLHTLEASFSPLASSKNVQLEVQGDGPLNVRADPRRLQQALGNLVENGLKHAPPGGTVRIEVRQLEGSIEFRVADSGAGVHDHQLERLFDRFYRVDDSRSRSSGGSGLGLAIVRAIASAHGGSAHAERSTLGGLEVSLRFPG
jgi:signal transduction histidine kinase